MPPYRPSVLDPDRIPELLRHALDASVEKAEAQRRLPEELYEVLSDCARSAS
jgi:hypothetical protein